MPEQPPEVSVLIVGYQNRRHLDASIGGALRSLEGVSAEVLFLDCSQDGSSEYVAERYPDVRVVPYAGNLGFGRGNNLLASHARGDLLILLNPDTAPTSDEIARLVRFSRGHSRAGAWGGRCVDPAGRPDLGSHQPMLTPCGMFLTAIGLASLRKGGLPTDAREPRAVPVISGAFLAMRRSLWNALGGFDPRYFMYAEEVDLCRRVASMGYQLWADPSIVLVHDAGSGDPYNPPRRVLMLRGNATFFRKHYGPVVSWLACSSMLLNEGLRLALARTVLAATRSPRAAPLATRSAFAIAQRRSWWSGWPHDTVHGVTH